MDLQWKPYGKSLREFLFEGDEEECLGKVGTLIRTERGILLIGSMNQNLGTCNCCSENEDATVIEYAFLDLSPDALRGQRLVTLTE